MSEVESTVKETRTRRIHLKYVVIVFVVLLGLVIATLVVAGVKLNDQIQTDDAFKDILGDRPRQYVDPDGGKPVNVLILGVDFRGGADPGRSDTTILLHLSADRERAYGVSVPRDLMVDRPACKDLSSGSTSPETGPVMWNAAYTLGGSACTVAQFEHMTGILVNHFVVVKFQAFRDVANALGGVPVCVPKTIDDPVHKIYLPAGRYDATGETAVSYVRARYMVGDGSDIGRMLRQQAFLASMVRKATSLGTLGNPVKAYKFLDAATKSFVTDPDLGRIANLVGMGRAVRHIGLDRIDFLTMPFGPYAPDPNRLAIGPGAQRMWDQLESDKVLDRQFTAGATTPEGAPHGSVAMTGTDPADYGLCADN